MKLIKIKLSGSNISSEEKVLSEINNFLSNPNLEYLNHQATLIQKPVIVNSEGTSQNLKVQDLNASHKGLNSSNYFKQVIPLDNFIVVTLFYRDYSSEVDLSELDNETAENVKRNLKNQTGIEEPKIVLESDSIKLGVPK